MSTDEDFSHWVQLPQNLFKPQFICCNRRNKLIISLGYTWKVITLQGLWASLLYLYDIRYMKEACIYILCIRVWVTLDSLVWWILKCRRLFTCRLHLSFSFCFYSCLFLVAVKLVNIKRYKQGNESCFGSVHWREAKTDLPKGCLAFVWLTLMCDDEQMFVMDFVSLQLTLKHLRCHYFIQLGMREHFCFMKSKLKKYVITKLTVLFKIEH